MNFNSRPSARGDLFPMTLTEVPILFQFTPLREGRQAEKYEITAIGYFNSRPSARGDYQRTVTRYDLDISIHAPPRGATVLALSPQLYHVHFNSRPSARGDVPSEAISKRELISIHAPPRGATSTPCFPQGF